MINFKQPRFKMFIQNYVEAQDLETHAALSVTRLDCTVGVCKLLLAGDHSFDHDFVYLILQFICIFSLGLKSLNQLCHCALVTLLILN